MASLSCSIGCSRGWFVQLHVCGCPGEHCRNNGCLPWLQVVRVSHAGNCLIEWLRCLGVYGSSILISLPGFPVLVPILQSHLQRPEGPSYLTAAIITVVTVILSFLGHKNISFREKLNSGGVDSDLQKPVV